MWPAHALGRLHRVVPSPGLRWSQVRALQLDLGAVSASLAGGTASTSRRPPALQHDFDYDVAVIGGGSAGLAMAREAAALGAAVVLYDFTTPSPMGYSWGGLGGTCNNVGCIPKKLFHHAGLLGEAVTDAASYGWQLPAALPHDWHTLVGMVQDHVKGSQWSYRVALADEGVEYVNGRARLVDDHVVESRAADGTVASASAAHVVVAVGGRPTYPPDITGVRDVAVSSDDVFSLASPPGSTVVVGGGYVALETAGFLQAFGHDTTVLIRSVPLRGFDQQMAELIVEDLRARGVTVVTGATPSAMSRTPDGRARVTYDADGVTHDAACDTVIVATGRTPSTTGLGLENVGVELSPSGKVVGAAPAGPDAERSSVPWVWALGDCLHGVPELAPVAIQSGRLLARRVMGMSSQAMRYDAVPTAVFTPTEYACVGLSEEAAVATLGDDGVEVYHLSYETLETQGARRAPPTTPCYVKVVCWSAAAGVDSRGRSGTVLGMHLFGPAAGEVMQGFAVAFRLGLTVADLWDTVGIHPTQAEELVTLDRTKRSGVPAVKTTC